MRQKGRTAGHGVPKTEHFLLMNFARAFLRKQKMIYFKVSERPPPEVSSMLSQSFRCKKGEIYFSLFVMSKQKKSFK